MTRSLAALAVAMSLACAACGDNDPGPTYHHDIAPLVSRHCLACHADPIADRKVVLASYEQTAQLANLIADAVEDGDMPPWGADHSGECGTFRYARSLDEREIETFVQWAANGAPEGDPASALPPPPPEPSIPAIAHADVTLDIGAMYAPTFPDGLVRCFVVDPGLDRDRLLTGFEVQPTNYGAVTQVTLFSLDDAASQAEASRLDALDTELGYQCMGDSLVPGARFVAGWAWGSSVEQLPAGTGIRLTTGSRLVMQLHYNAIIGNGVPDRTLIDLQLDDSVREANWIRGGPETFTLAGGPRTAEISGTFRVPSDVDVYGVYPRMHLYGLSLQVTEPSQCLLAMEEWEFHKLQRLFEYVAPTRLNAATEVSVSCTFITENLTEDLVSGNAPDQEECSAYLYSVVP